MIKYVPWITAAFLFCLIFIVKKAEATDRHEEKHDHQTVIINKDDGLAKGIAIGAILTCGIRSVYIRSMENRWTWCGEEKPKPLPDPGPTVKDVTPDIPTGVRLYQ